MLRQSQAANLTALLVFDLEGLARGDNYRGGGIERRSGNRPIKHYMIL